MVESREEFHCRKCRYVRVGRSGFSGCPPAKRLLRIVVDRGLYALPLLLQIAATICVGIWAEEDGDFDNPSRPH